MKNCCLLIFIISLATLQYSHCQKRKVHLPKSEYKDTVDVFWYKYTLERVQKLKIANLKFSPYKYHFRLWTGSKALEIWKNENGHINAKITQWVVEYVENDKRRRVFSENLHLPKQQISEVKRLIDSTQILTIPNDSEIKNWKQGVDGITYIMEFCDQHNYYIKTYWTPSFQKDVIEAQVVEKFVQRIKKVAKYDLIWNVFQAKIPFYRYTPQDGGAMIATHLWSNEKIVLYRQKRWQYLRSLRKKKKRKHNKL